MNDYILLLLLLKTENVGNRITIRLKKNLFALHLTSIK